MTPEQKIEIARTSLIRRCPFYASALLSLKFIRDDECKLAIYGTMCTNGKWLAWVPAYVDALTLGQLRTELLHEVGHCLLGHCDPARVKKRDPARWNLAADFVVDRVCQSLIDQNDRFDVKLEVPAVFSEHEQYAGLLVEQIYERLPESSGKKGFGQGSGLPKGKGGKPLAGDALLEALEAAGIRTSIQPCDAEEAKQVAEHWRKVKQSALAAGLLAGSEAEEIAAADVSYVPWTAFLEEFLTVHSTMPSDYSWYPPDVRFAWQGLYTPSVVCEGTGPFAFVLDTSGSISAQDASNFLGVCKRVVDIVRPEKVWILQTDTQVQSQVEIETPDGASFQTVDIHGRGGTDFREVFRVLARLRPLCCVFLTDLETCGWAEEAPRFPVLWVTQGRAGHPQPPFGKVVYL